MTNALLDSESSRMAAWFLALDPNLIVFWRPDQTTTFENILLIQPSSTPDYKQMSRVGEIVVNISSSLERGKADMKEHDTNYLFIFICADLSFMTYRKPDKDAHEFMCINASGDAKLSRNWSWIHFPQEIQDNILAKFRIDG